ncbi:MAG: hypothetical protein NW202_11235 [Nitrospira sp.]|nr:hypothetical protein [Nitrospira sp.]
MRKRVVIGFPVLLVALVALVWLWWAVTEGPFRDPQEALRDFYEAKDRAEDQLMDPLILAGKDVVPLVINDLPNKEIRLRRYAIGFLGNGRHTQALPALEAILKDDTEIYYFRADALKAIYQVSPMRAKELAPQFVNGQELLGEVAQDIVAGETTIYFERSYSDAFWHVHN